MGQGTNMINCSPEGNSSGKVKSSKNSTLEWKCFIDNNYSVATVMLEKNDRWYLDCHRTAPPALPWHESTASIKITDKFCVIFQFFFLPECFSVLLHILQTNETPSEKGIETKFIGQLGVIYLCLVSIATRCCFFLSEQPASRAGSRWSEWDPKIIAWWDCSQLFFFFLFCLQQVKDIALVKSRAFCFNKFKLNTSQGTRYPALWGLWEMRKLKLQISFKET